jgi:tRNA threonylcarbamoyl adenosine modification protein YeaZ
VTSVKSEQLIMKILGIEWSSPQRSLALGQWSPEQGLRVLSTAPMSVGSETAYFEAFEYLEKHSGMQRAEIGAVVVGLGPGSYAGIRLAIATAYSWRLANQAKLVGISSLQAIALKAFQSGSFQQVHTVVDAQRGDSYHAVFDKSRDGKIQVTHPASLKRSGQTIPDAFSGACIAGPDPERWISGTHAGKVPCMEVFPEAQCLLEAAAPSLAGPGSHMLEPIYLRPTHFVKSPTRGVSPLHQDAGAGLSSDA